MFFKESVCCTVIEVRGAAIALTNQSIIASWKGPGWPHIVNGLRGNIRTQVSLLLVPSQPMCSSEQIGDLATYPNWGCPPQTANTVPLIGSKVVLLNFFDISSTESIPLPNLIIV